MAKAGDHRVRVTKMLIRRAFTDMIGKMSIERISVKELCQRAGINRGTFYAHYTDIYDLRDKLEQEMMTDFQRALEPCSRPRWAWTCSLRSPRPSSAASRTTRTSAR